MAYPGELDLANVSYTSRRVDADALSRAPSGEPFVDEAYSCLDELLQSVEVVASIGFVNGAGERRGMTRDEAVLAGTMVRLAKLHATLVEPAVFASAERFSLVWRPAIESSVNLVYFVQQGSPELLESFVRYSLRLDKRLLARVQQDVETQGVERSHLQDRMLQAFPEAFIGSDVDPREVDEASRADWSGRGGIHGRFKAIGWEGLYSLFQIASHYSHGNWHDLTVHHLGRSEGTVGHHPALELSLPTVQPATAVARLISAATHAYLLHVVGPSEDRDVLADRIDYCGQKAELIDQIHERWMQVSDEKRSR